MRMYAEDFKGIVITAKASPSIEVDWMLSGSLRVARDSQPALCDFYENHPDISERVRHLWGPEETLSYPCFLELSALALGGGLLFGLDTDTFVSSIERLCLTAPENLPFDAETSDDRDRLLRRLDLLRTNDRVRRHYVEVIGEVSSHVRGLWEAEGRRAVVAAIEEYSAYLRGGSDPKELALSYLEHVNCADIGRDEVTRLIDGLGKECEIVLVPSFFTAKGLIADLPGMLIIGGTTRPGAATARARTEDLARQLKAIADPTRLAILDALSQNEMSITDVTNLFGLAQPTVSNHVKQLRDAGVVTSSTTGKRRQLTVRREVVSEIVRALDQIFDLEKSGPVEG